MFARSASSTLGPAKPEVSIAVWMPFSFAPANTRPTKAGCSNASPPDSVSPPPVALNTPR